MSQGVLGSTGQHLSLPPQQTSVSDVSVVVNQNISAGALPP